MGLRFDPIGGGQFKQAVQQIIDAERQPIKALEARKGKEDTRLKLFQEFKSKFNNLDKLLSDISSFRKFRELKVDVGDGQNLVSVTVDKEHAEPGQYTIQIDELAARSSTISNGFESPTEPILGQGFITLSLPNGDSTEISISEETSSLRGIATIINQKTTSPFRAAVIRDDSEPDNPWKLILTGKKEGAANQMDQPEFYFLNADSDISIEDDKEAKNAQIVMDGFPIELESNDVNEFLPGVNLHLKQARPDLPFTMTITEDYQKISAKVKGVVDQINQVLAFILKQNAIDQHTDTTTTFAGDTSLQSMEYRLRNIMHDGFLSGDPDDDNTLVIHLNEIGIEFDKTGQLTFKEEKFDSALEKHFDQIAEALTSPIGFVNQMRQTVEGYTRASNGLLSSKEQGLRARIKDIDDQISQKETAAEQKKQSVVAQFSRLEATLGNLQRQQQYLSATLPGAGAGGNVISQLLGG